MATKPDSRRSKTTERGISRVPTQPYVSKPDSEPPSTSADVPASEKEFDPFRFAVTELPTGMRQELIATQLPVVPAEQLFDTKPPNRHFATSVSNEPPGVPDSLPAVDSSKSAALPARSKRPLLLGLFALMVLAVAIVLASRAPDRPKAIAQPVVDTQSNRAPTPAVVQPPAPVPNNEQVTESPSSAPPRKPEPPAAERAPVTKSARTLLKTQGTSAAALPQPTVASGLPEAPPTPKKESALGSVLAPPPD
jgi:hypothetical protein